MGEIPKLCQIASKNSVKCDNNIWKKKALIALARGHGLKFIFSLVLYQTLMVNGNLVPTLFLHQWDKISFEVAFEFLCLFDAYWISKANFKAFI